MPILIFRSVSLNSAVSFLMYRECGSPSISGSIMFITLNRLIGGDRANGLGYTVIPTELREKDLEVLYPRMNGTGCLTTQESSPIFVSNAYAQIVGTLWAAGVKVVNVMTVKVGQEEGAESAINPLAVKKIETKHSLWGRSKKVVLTFKSGHKIDVIGSSKPLMKKINDAKYPHRAAGEPA